MGIFRKSPSKTDGPATGLLSRLQNKLNATRQNLARGLGDLLLGKRALDPELFEDLETRLLAADLGVDLVTELLDDLTGRVSRKELADSAALYGALRHLLLDIVKDCAVPLQLPSSSRPFCVMVVGVNGAGKTTSIGKIAQQWTHAGKRVLVGAGDTFRAAAIEQLEVWCERVKVPLVRQQIGADSASVAHDAIEAGKARSVDLVLIDTAGRLQTQIGLMDELRKIKRVCERALPGAPHEVLLVLDAGVGQNALSQLRHFSEAVGVTGLCITKLDGTAKGGVLFALCRAAHLPVRYIGVGEDVADLRPFNAEEFVEALIPQPGEGMTD